MAFKLQVAVQMVVLLLAVGQCCINGQAQPQGESQEEPIEESSHADYRQFLNALQSNGPRYYRGYDESVDNGLTNPLDRFHMQRMLRSALPAFPSSRQQVGGYQSANVMDQPIGSSPGVQRFYAMYRLPEMKRQARYRQCYFNPVSCFK